MSIDGFLNVNKPEGMTSFNIVARLRHLSSEKRVGHAGTLDPIATGVLPICFGQATRVVSFLIDSNKTYIAQIELGTATNTFDREGEITHSDDPSGVTVAQVEMALAKFQGSIEQIPPSHSALKYRGRRYYELARAGILIEPRPRKVNIDNIALVDCQLPLITIKVVCGKGTYVRSLANDLGSCLGCGAHLKSLARIQCGPFSIEDALSMPEIESAFQQGTWKKLLHPMDSPVLNWKAAIVNKRDEAAIRNGRSISLKQDHPHSEEYCRAYSSDGHFIAVLRFIADEKLWHPEKVFSPQPVVPCDNHQ